MKYIVSVAQENHDGTVGTLQNAYDTEEQARSAVYSEMASAYASCVLASDTVVLFATNGYVLDTLHMQGKRAEAEKPATSESAATAGSESTSEAVPESAAATSETAGA